MTKTPVSAVLITQNAASMLAACLASVAFCDEILVVDSGSTDDTISIAQSCGAKKVVNNIVQEQKPGAKKEDEKKG